MAYKILNKKVIHISPPNNLTDYQSRKIENAKKPVKMLKLIDKIKQQKFEINGKRVRLSYC